MEDVELFLSLLKWLMNLGNSLHIKFGLESFGSSLSIGFPRTLVIHIIVA